MARYPLIKRGGQREWSGRPLEWCRLINCSRSHKSRAWRWERGELCAWLWLDVWILNALHRQQCIYTTVYLFVLWFACIQPPTFTVQPLYFRYKKKITSSFYFLLRSWMQNEKAQTAEVLAFVFCRHRYSLFSMLLPSDIFKLQSCPYCGVTKERPSCHLGPGNCSFSFLYSTRGPASWLQ